MADFAVHGKKGTGKSKFAVYLLRQAAAAGPRIACNFPIHLGKLLPRWHRIAYTQLPNRPTREDLDALGHGNPDSYDEEKNGVLILDELSVIAQHDGDGEVSVGEVMAGAGARSFGPMLLVPSLIGLSPIGAIPGLPAVMVAVEILVIVQMLAGLKHFWIPRWLARQHISARRLARGMNALRKPARIADLLLKPRLSFLTEGAFFYLIAIACLAVALVTPLIELVPIAGIVPNAAVVAFSLAITARADGREPIVLALGEEEFPMAPDWP